MRETSLANITPSSSTAAALPAELSEEQLEQIQAAARPVPPALRPAFLERVAAALAGRRFGNGDIQRACAGAQKEMLGLVDFKPSRGR
jgi:hypothetical protein